MAIELNNKLVDNDLTRAELNNRVVVKKTTENDFETICNTIAHGFNLSSPKEAEMQLMHSNVLLKESVKLVDSKTDEIYGLLIFTEYPINNGSPIMMKKPILGEILSKYNQVNGHSFIIDKRLRGLDYDKEMVEFNLSYLVKNYDFIWCGVETDLKSHNYWKKQGFIPLFKISEASFYILPLKESWIDDIYKEMARRCLTTKNEESNC